jgi:hypothetical protein
MSKKEIRLALKNSTFFVDGVFLAKVLLFFCGVLAVQRFTLEASSAIIFLVPFALFIFCIFSGRNKYALSYLVVALMLSVGNGGDVYPVSPLVLRMCLSLSCIAALFYFSQARLKKNHLIGYLFVLSIYSLISFRYSDSSTAFDLETFKRDFLIITLFVAILLNTGFEKIDTSVIYFATTGYLVGEFINAIFFYQHLGEATEYMSYDGLKAMVIFPLIYSLIKKHNVYLVIITLIPTLIVLAMYGSRTLILTLLALFLLALLVAIAMRHFRYIFGLILFFSLVYSFDLINLLKSNEAMTVYKPVAALVDIFSNDDGASIVDIFKLMDPVRFAEHEIFFSRPLFEILFGTAPGSGLIDTDGLLSFVTHDQTAFSSIEIENSIYFNFHDAWIDYGVRFGLIPVLLLLYLLVMRHMINGQPMKGIFFGILLLNTSFATGGILMIFLFAKFFPSDEIFQSRDRLSSLAHQ